MKRTSKRGALFSNRVSETKPFLCAEVIGLMKKSELPEKICVTCGLPFKWRKKWARNWDEVKYCSERCRRNKHKK